MANRTATYRLTASALGAWAATYDIPTSTALTIQQAAHLVSQHVRETGVPLTAHITTHEGVVDGITLLRDPSRTFGTPDTYTVHGAARSLADHQGWQHRRATGPRPALLVGLGLVPGYGNADLPATPREVLDHLRQAEYLGQMSWATHHSARLVTNDAAGEPEVRTHTEPAIVLEADQDQALAIAQIAHALRQKRFSVTNFDVPQTTRAYALETR